MKDIVIVGAGGFGREVQWLIESINKVKKEWNILGYIDDGIEQGEIIGGYSILGGCGYLLDYDGKIHAVIAIGSAKTRKSVVEKLRKNPNIYYPNLVSPDTLTSSKFKLGVGNILCAGCIMTTDWCIGDFNIINLDCTVGHDAEIGSFVTIYPSVNVSGNVKIGDISEIGTGSNIIQEICIGEKIVIGAGSVVVRDILEPGTYVGSPAFKLKDKHA